MFDQTQSLYLVQACAMMGHPLELFRIIPILCISVLLGFTAQAYGIFAGAWVEIKVS